MQPSPHPEPRRDLDRRPGRKPGRRLRRGLTVAVLVATLPVLSGCASNFNSPVLQDYNPAVGVNWRKGQVWAMNMLVVLSESGRGTLVGSLLNQTNRADRLVGATLRSEPGEQPLRSSMLRSSVTLPPQQLVRLDQPPTVLAQGDVSPGRFVTMTLQFQRSAPVQVKIPVVAPTGPYADVPIPGGSSGQGSGSTASPSATPATPSATPSGSASQRPRQGAPANR